MNRLGSRAAEGGDALRGEDEAESLRWSDDEGSDDDEQTGKIDIVHRATLPEQIVEYKALLLSLDFDRTTDVSFPLAARAHLERLVNEYWDVCAKPEAEERDDAAAQDRPAGRTAGEERPKRQVIGKLKQMIVSHPQSRSSPLLLRWPLLAADVPRPTWTLADEVVAAMERYRRFKMPEAGRKVRIEESVEGVTGDLATPAIVNCQHALLSLLHDLSQCAKARKTSHGSVQQARNAIIDWRDVVSHISMRPDVPSRVAQETQRRIENIYGQVSSAAAPAAWIAHLGMGGTDRIMNVVKAEGFDAPAESRKMVQPRQQTSRERAHDLLQDLDRSILLPNIRKRARYLQDAPYGRQRRRGKR